MTDANAIQFGGSHYKRGGDYQHWDWVAEAELSYYEACATKYVSRHRLKNGMEDLNKAGHFVQKMMELREAGKIQSIFHRRGQSYTGTSRKFAATNELSHHEAAFCEILSNWTCQAELRKALEIVETLKANLTGDEVA